jgi:hypothetical protein
MGVAGHALGLERLKPSCSNGEHAGHLRLAALGQADFAGLVQQDLAVVILMQAQGLARDVHLAHHGSAVLAGAIELRRLCDGFSGGHANPPRSERSA